MSWILLGIRLCEGGEEVFHDVQSYPLKIKKIDSAPLWKLRFSTAKHEAGLHQLQKPHTSSVTENLWSNLVTKLFR